MAKSKKNFGIQVEGLNTLLDRLNTLGVTTEEAVDVALNAAKTEVNKGIEAAMNASIYNFDRTGETKESLDKSKSVEWNASKATINVGFDIENGGLPSIFLMYGTPKVAPDKNLFNSIFGAATKKKIYAAEEQAIYEALRKAGLK